MSETPSDRHNRLAREFVTNVAGTTATNAEFMVVMESVLLAGMLVMHKLHGLSAPAAASMIDDALNRATERFTALQAGRPT